MRAAAVRCTAAFFCAGGTDDVLGEEVLPAIHNEGRTRL